RFTDYEVLVVDDCSTDNSVAEVKKLLPHFDGRLKIFTTEKNSGGAGVPRNIGIKNSSGKYVTFIDNDDVILPDALENFFAVAEFYNADVVYAEKYFQVEGDAKISGKNLKVVHNMKTAELVDVPTLEPFDINERIRRDMANKFLTLPWGKFYRRDFLLANEIFFPQMKCAEDVTFCFKCLCLAKNYVRIPHMTNIHRYRQGSAGLHVFNTPAEGVYYWLDVLTKNISELDDFTSTLDLEPNFRQNVLAFYIRLHFTMIKELFRGVPPYGVQEIFYNELQNPELNLAGKNLLTAYLCTEKFLTR
ncbi:MAG: glycosyltransferase family 2 protein, partial [Selenomonadaceae bacterium]|nr:glycosyltransferase family 2 protein [Selenomonadaceae bacterium]